jgi:GLPGLI family protein
MKNSLLILLIFCPVICFSQSYRITYGKSNNYNKEEFDAIKDPMIKENIARINYSISKMDFQLLISGDIARFNYIDKLKDDDFDRRAIGIGGGSETYYYDASKDMVICESELMGETFFIESNISKDYKWQITNETKQIGEYKCFRAEAVVGFDDFRGKGSYILEAWFCPSFPFKYGPCEYYGLPGIVMEAGQLNSKIRFFVKKIEKITPEQAKINFPSNKTLTHQEFTQKFNEVMKNISEQ